MTTLQFATDRREQMLDVTGAIKAAVRAAGVTEGICVVHSPHTTCAVTVNEGWDVAVQEDALRQLQRLVPRDGAFAHSEGNSDAHIKSMAVGAGAVLPVAGGELQLGRWQAVFLCEFDGPRTRELWLVVK